MNQIWLVPSVWRQRMSAVPSPSKSPTPAIRQFMSATGGRLRVAVARLPSMCQIWPAPLSCRQSRSSRPSALKSFIRAAAGAGAVTWIVKVSLVENSPSKTRIVTSWLVAVS